MITSLPFKQKLPEKALYAELAARHGHYCPMSTLGLRLGWLVSPLFLNADLTASYHARTCAVDGLCLSLGEEKFSVSDRGEHVLKMAMREVLWEISFRPQTLELAASYRLLTEAAQQDLLEQLRQAPSDDLVHVQRNEVTS